MSAIKLTVHSLGSGNCSLTGKESDGLVVTFDDRTVEGFLSWKAFQQLLRMKVGAAKSVPPALPVNGEA